ncbi:DUF2721 domain-containing protein [Lichenibacterium minor]|uniref:DUF2721 domain-containing protein n=1 Tax=Lichenibacterium minor TaxID=2316528 RepID=A0A4Q2U5E9_9HYPH|nr:DUF2721 domain-containing protein [Lichenibacterium minor]RYC31028.1 DUF2721 domain-containing protein [Lichenibacterium minor]
MPLSPPAFTKLDDVAHIIQVALTPVFLLSGIGTLINVFSTRLARVADQVDRIAETVAKASDSDKAAMGHRLDRLRLRSRALDVAVILGAVGGSATCAAVLTLFYGALHDGVAASALYGFFGLAIACTIAALCAFTVEMVMASRLVRLRIARGERDAER